MFLSHLITVTLTSVKPRSKQKCTQTQSGFAPLLFAVFWLWVSVNQKFRKVLINSKRQQGARKKKNAAQL